MAMKPCKECKVEISTSAKVCPHCGKKMPTGGITLPAKIALGFIGLMALGAVAEEFGKGHESPKTESCQSTGKSPSPEPQAETYSLFNARDLNRAYQENEVAADEKFKGKQLAIDGVVGEISKDFMDNLYVVIPAGEMLEDIHAYFETQEKGQLAQLKRGQRIRVLGRVDGLMMKSVMLKSCRILPEKPSK